MRLGSQCVRHCILLFWKVWSLECCGSTQLSEAFALEGFSPRASLAPEEKQKGLPKLCRATALQRRTPMPDRCFGHSSSTQGSEHVWNRRGVGWRGRGRNGVGACEDGA